jgi:hypothetical protein
MMRTREIAAVRAPSLRTASVGAIGKEMGKNAGSKLTLHNQSSMNQIC